MNKKCFCIAFSKLLQHLTVSCTLVKTTEKVIREVLKSAVDFSRIFAALKPLTLCLLGFVAFSSSASTETLIIKADPHAPKNHQAGMIQGNPYLARGEAKVILNEVTSNNPGIWANKKLNVVTGKNIVKTDENPDADIQITRLESTKDQTENAPHFAVDISELGGMYAGKIHLVGTEQGVGVRNAGHIGAGSESLTIDSAGRIVNRGSLSSQQQITVKSEREIENTGLIEAKTQQVNLRSATAVKQDGSVIARRGDVNIKAKNVITQRGETIARRKVSYQTDQIRTAQSALTAAGASAVNSQNHQSDKQNTAAINILAHHQAHLSSRHITDGRLSVSAQHADIKNSRNIARNIAVDIQPGGVQTNNRRVSAVGNLIISTPKNNIKSAHSSVISANRNIKTGSEQTGTDGLLLKAMSGLLLDAGTTLQQRYTMAARKVKSNVQPAYFADRNEIVSQKQAFMDTAHINAHMENVTEESLNQRLGTFLAQNSTEIRVLANTLKPYNPKQAETAQNLQKAQKPEVRLKTNPNRAVAEKDLQFTDIKRWLSSDYMLNALRHEHEIVQKRSGRNRFSQQCWANDQINPLTENNFSEKDIILKQ